MLTQAIGKCGCEHILREKWGVNPLHVEGAKCGPEVWARTQIIGFSGRRTNRPGDALFRSNRDGFRIGSIQDTQDLNYPRQAKRNVQDMGQPETF